VHEPLASALWSDSLEYWRTGNLFDQAHLLFTSNFLQLAVEQQR